MTNGNRKAAPSRRIGAWVLLCVMLAVVPGAMVSCKSSAQKAPVASSTSAKAQDQESTLSITNGYRVSMDFNIIMPDNMIAASSKGKEPLSFIQGKHEIFPALEAALVGMKPGEKKLVALTGDQAFGPYDESKKIAVKREQLPADAKVGGFVKTKDGRKAKIVDLSADSAVLDFNHQLAGKNLVFEVTILKVEKQP